jgi:GNAT superfamily N-acetyltransferase
MSVTLVPFGEEHIAPAADLLAVRHRRDRINAPELPSKFEHPDEAEVVLQELLAVAGTRGMVALRDGVAIGYLLGATELQAPTDAFSGLTRPRSINIPYAGHAAAPEAWERLYPRLYAALAEGWVAGGFTAHYLTTPADRDAEGIWFDLGFGRSAALAVRETRPRDERERTVPQGLEIRRAEESDREAVQGLPTALLRYWTEPPLFLPFFPESVAAQRQLGLELFDDPACHVWLAVRDGRPACIFLFLAPESPHWFVAPIETPERSVYLFMVYTAAEERGAGVSTALLDHTMSWAHELGYDHCLLHYLSATPASGFWRGQGFRPTHHWLCRIVDERAVWARG